ncbi:hypothetical protein Dcar01_03717 [Deinococcus carri]|uniref:Transposase n=1 Tax=Deinococcus carri TaxID=1211323 RepID=A0ABP9WEF2_9DEIO
MIPKKSAFSPHFFRADASGKGSGFRELEGLTVFSRQARKWTGAA